MVRSMAALGDAAGAIVADAAAVACGLGTPPALEHAASAMAAMTIEARTRVFTRGSFGGGISAKMSVGLASAARVVQPAER
jgi:hypothetical protein